MTKQCAACSVEHLATATSLLEEAGGTGVSPPITSGELQELSEEIMDKHFSSESCEACSVGAKSLNTSNAYNAYTNTLFGNPPFGDFKNKNKGDSMASMKGTVKTGLKYAIPIVAGQVGGTFIDRALLGRKLIGPLDMATAAKLAVGFGSIAYGSRGKYGLYAGLFGAALIADVLNKLVASRIMPTPAPVVPATAGATMVARPIGTARID